MDGPDPRLGLLRRARLENLAPIAQGSNQVLRANLVLRGERVGGAIYKPRSGESPLWDFPGGTLYRREAAAYEVDAALGWGLVPPTIVREGPCGIGSLQWMIEPAQAYPLAMLRKPTGLALLRLAVFDYVTNNADRKSLHVLRWPNGSLAAIDHGLTFNTDYKLRTALSHLTGAAVPKRIRGDLAVLAGPGRARVSGRLRDFVESAEIDQFFSRVARLLKDGRIPAPAPRMWYW